MPTYEYRCNKCMSKIVLSRNVDERDEEVECPCGHKSSRMYTTVGIQFKGSGFYVNGGQTVSVFATEVDVGDISIARSMYGDEVRMSQEDSTIYIPKEKIESLIEALLYVQEKL